MDAIKALLTERPFSALPSWTMATRPRLVLAFPTPRTASTNRLTTRTIGRTEWLRITIGCVFCDATPPGDRSARHVS